MKPIIDKENVKSLFESKFIKVFDLEYAPGKHYFDATRRNSEDLVACKKDEEFKKMLPDAVTCFVILKIKGEEPKLLLDYEYRYPVGQFLLSPPAGLIDPEDREYEDALKRAAIREIKEETNIDVKDSDRVYVVSPCSFATPGFTDESNALVAAVVELEDASCLNSAGAVGSELFDGFHLVDEREAKEILKNARDEHGNFFSIFTWSALMYFVSGMWDEE